MPTITACGAVLKIIGTDVVRPDNSLDREGLKAALFTNSCPVGNLGGKVDFIVCFVNQGPQPGYFGSIDHSLAPRPLRGIIYLADSLANVSLSRLAGLLYGGVAHEMGHYWLAPGGAKIRVGNTEVDTPTDQQIAQALNQGLEFPPYSIIGRQDCHWSPFIDGDSTPMEAGNLGTPVKTRGFGPMEWFGHWDQVTGQDKIKQTFTLPEGNVEIQGRFSTLERWLIGSYKPPTTTWGTLWPSFLVVAPRWSFPFDFESGLFVRLRTGQTWYLGFHCGPHEVCAHEISRSAPDQVIPIQSDPFDPYIRVGARVVQKGSSINLQMRLWAPRSLFRRPGQDGRVTYWRNRVNPSCDEIMRDVAQGTTMSTSDIWSGWKTLASVQGTVDRVGLSSREHPGKNDVHTLLSATLCQCEAGVTTPVPTTDLQQDFPVAGPALLPSGQLMMPYLLADGSTPFYEETPTSPSAPKLLKAAPAGDFAFGGIVSLDRCVQCSWAGGFKTGKKMVGRTEYVALNRFIPPWTSADRAIRQATPMNGAYKVLFCLAGRTDTITSAMIANLDLVRRGWDMYSPLLMDRKSDSNVF